MAFFGTAASTTAAPTADKDVELIEPPTDSISSVSFSPQADYLAVGSWDNSVRVVSGPPFRTVSLTLSYRSEFMKLAPKDNPRAKQCISTKAPFSTSAGVK
jgi:WD40 repeat protein